MLTGAWNATDKSPRCSPDACCGFGCHVLVNLKRAMPVSKNHKYVQYSGGIVTE
jgi:hypothetical protein